MNQNRVPGLRFRVRHLLIMAIYFALLMGVLVPVVRYLGRTGPIDGALAILLVSPWLLGLLVLVIENRGPVKYWAAPLLLSLTSPALAIYHDWWLLAAWQTTGAVPNVIISLLINILLVGSFTYFVAAMRPDHCPRCGHRALIPLSWPSLRPKRLSRTRWCGSCGAQYWRQGNGLWQKERRATWVDALNQDSAGEIVPPTHKPKWLKPRAENPASRPNPTTGA